MDMHDFPHAYPPEKLFKEMLNKDPFEQFSDWYRSAEEAQVPEVNAMTLATATKQGIPSCRTVLLKHFDADGFLFFTNYQSRKAKELEENPHAMIKLFWPELLRQIIVEGKVEKITEQESKDYFASRPRGSQIGAWASKQDQILYAKDALERAFSEVEKQFEGKEIPLPPHWGGYRLIPTRFEFWQAKKNRLHDRFQYTQEKNTWKIERLSP